MDSREMGIHGRKRGSRKNGMGTCGAWVVFGIGVEGIGMEDAFGFGTFVFYGRGCLVGLVPWVGRVWIVPFSPVLYLTGYQSNSLT